MKQINCTTFSEFPGNVEILITHTLSFFMEGKEFHPQNVERKSTKTSISSLIALQQTFKKRSPIYVGSVSSGHQSSRDQSKPYTTTFLIEKKQKLLQQKPESLGGIFQGITAYVNGYMKDSSDLEIRKLVQLYSGNVR